MRIYLDACIWIDVLEKRHPETIKLLNSIDEMTIIVSPLLIKEISGVGYPEKHVRKMFRHHAMANITRTQLQEARIVARKRKLPFHDALHAIIAKDNGAAIITRDRHFLRLRDVVEVIMPEVSS